MILITYIMIASLIVCLVSFGAIIHMALDNAKHHRAMEQLDAKRAEQELEKAEAQARDRLGLQQAQDEAVAKARKEQDEAQFQRDIKNFPGHSVDVFGQPFGGWEDALKSLEDRGLSLDEPNDDFDRIRKVVQVGLEFNRAVLSNASDPTYLDEHRAKFARASVHVADAQACLRHLNAIETSWAREVRDAMDEATDPAMAETKAVGRF